MEYIDNTYVINLDTSKDRLDAIKQQLSKQNIQFTRIPAINGKKLTQEEIRLNCTPFAQMFCPRNIIGCAMSHKKVWQKIIDNNDRYAIVFEDDCKIAKNFKKKLNRCLNELFENDKDWDFLYLGYFGPAKKNDSFMNYVHDIILNKIQDKNGFNKKLKNIFVPQSPVGFHSYIISNKCAKRLLKYMNKINYHVDAEFLHYANKFNVYATVEKLGNQYSTVDNSTLNEYKFPKLINWVNDKFRDVDGISYSYWLGSPIIQIKNIPVNLYFILFSLCVLFIPNTKIHLIMIIYMYLELSLDLRNVNIISLYILMIYSKIL